MTVEAAFLLSSVRHSLNSSAPTPDPEGIDWKTVLDLAHAHAVTPMLYTALQNAPVPDSVSDELRLRFEQSVRWSLAQSAELARLAALFEKFGIPMVALKGPTLSQYLYGDLASRMFGDVDVLVKPEDVLVIRDTLISSGYRATNSLPWNSRSACLRLRGREMAFESPFAVSVDVHWRLVPPHFASVFDKLDPWESLRIESFAGRQVRTLALETQLLFLCAHGTKHMFERVGWICDIARFLRVTPTLDWEGIVAQSQHAHALRQILLSIRLAVDLFGGSIPVELPTDPAVEPLISIIRTRLLAGGTPPVPARESARFSLRLLERPDHHLRFLFGEYLTPSEAEYRVLQLPPWLHFLYYPFRPMRLLWKHAFVR